MAGISHTDGVRARPSVAEGEPASPAPGIREALLIAGIVLLDLVLIVVTYARLPSGDVYNTSIDGVRGGFGRALVSLNFPVALLALGLLGVAANALLDSRRRLVTATALASIPLCLTTTLVVHQRDLDAAARNVVPAVGVALIALLIALTVLTYGAPPTPRARGDAVRVALGALLALIAIPWIFALLGFYAPDPVLADEKIARDPPLPAVHLGSHHGLDGVLVAFTGLALSRALPAFRHRTVMAVTSPVLALAVAYGVAVALQDFTLEQLWKRGTIDWKPPSVTMPSLTWGWLVILAAAAVVELAWFRRERQAYLAQPQPDAA